MSRRDPEKRREYQREWLEKHPDYHREWQRAAYRDRPEYRASVIRRARTYAASHSRDRSGYRRDYKKAVLWVGGESINFNTMPPEVREVAIALKEVRKAVISSKKERSL